MTGRAIFRLSPIGLLLVLAACGGGGGPKTVTVTEPAPTSTTAAQATSVRAYFLLNGKVQPVLRTVPQTKAVAGAALNQLLQGPTAQEKQLGLSTQVSGESSLSVDRSNGVLTLHGDVAPGAPLAQVVFTLTQFANSTTAEVGGKQYTRRDFEDFAPAILVELPLPFENVKSPLRAAGTANTFEATFQYELKDASGNVLAKHFVTASSGSGTRGTFDVTIPFKAPESTSGTFTVWEDSAANGQRIHVVAIPVTFQH